MASSLTRKEMSQMFRRITRKKEEKKVETPQLPQDAQGFICPICMEALRSAEALQVHWKAAHNDDKTGAGSSATDFDSGLNVQSSTMDSSTYVPPLPQEEEDELEHYRLQVKIMADIINEERSYCASLKVELAKLEESLEKSGDQTREELRSMKQMFEQSEQSKSAMTAEIVRLTTETSYLQQEKQNLLEANKKVTNKAGGLAVNVASLQARLDESLGKVDGLNSQALTLQSKLREQELRNERLSVKLQQRPEADDVHAMQQQLLSLHIVMEQSASEHEKKLQLASHDMQQVQEEKNQLEEQLVAYKEQLSLLPKQEELTRLEFQVSSLEKEVDNKQAVVAKVEAQLAEVQTKYEAAPKLEILQNLNSDIERLAHELKLTKEEQSVKEKLTQSLQHELQQAPKQEYVEKLTHDIEETSVRLQQKDEHLRSLEISVKQLELQLERAPKQQDLERRDSKIRELELELAAAPRPAKVERLETTVKSLQEQLNDAPKQHQVDHLQSTLKAVQSSLQLAKEQIQEKELAYAKLQEHSVQLQTECEKKGGFVDALQSEVKEIEQDKHEKELALAACKQENIGMKRQIVQLENKVTYSESEQRKLEGDIQESKAAISQLHFEKAELIRKTEAGEGATTAISQLEQEKKALYVKLESAYVANQQKCEEYEKRLDATNAKNDKLIEQLESVREEGRSLKEQNHKMELSLAAAQEKFDLLTADLHSKDSALSRKSKDYTQAQIEHKEKVESLTSEWNKLKGQNDALEFDIKQVKAAASEQEQEMKSQVQFMENEAQKKLEEFSSKLHSKAAQLEEREKELIELKVRMEQELASLQQQLFTKNKELQHAQVMMQETLQSSKNSEDSMRSSLEAFKSQFAAEKAALIAQHQEKVGTLERAIAEKHEMLRQRQEENALLQDHQRKLEDDFYNIKASMELEVTKLKSQLCESEGKVAALQSDFSTILASSKEDQSRIEAQVTEKQLLIAEFEAKLKAKQEDFDTWNKENAETVKDLNKQITKMQTELHLKSEALESQIKQHDTIRHQLEVKLESESKLHEELGSLRVRLEHVDSKMKTETTKSVSLKAEISSLNLDLSEKMETVRSLNQRLELKQEMVEALQNDLVRGQAEFDLKYTDYDEQVQQTRQELEYETKKTAALELELEGARRDFKDLNVQLDQAEEKQIASQVKMKKLEQELIKKKDELSSAIQNGSMALKELEQKVTQARENNEMLRLDKASLQDKLQEMQEHIAQISQTEAAVQYQVEQLKQALKDKEYEWSAETLKLEYEQETVAQQVVDRETQITVLKERLSQNRSEIDRIEDQHKTALQELQNEIGKLTDESAATQSSCKALKDMKEKAEQRHQIELSALTTSLATVRQQLDGSKIRANNAEAQVKILSNQLTGLTEKSDLLTEEHRVLLEKFVVEEEQKQSLLEQNAHLQHQIDEVQAGMQELGREYQTLQILHSRQLERKWERDSDAVACRNCKKDFSVGMRKHHCRRCGLIFCQPCSSKQARLPSSKSPVRVCDTCHTELHLS